MSKFQSGLIKASAFERYQRLAAVKSFCEERLAQKISLANAAEVAGLEYTYFSSFFHNAVGVRFGDWLRYLRVMRAQSLIRESKLPLASVAERCGFNNLRTFQRAFKRVASMTPRQFRREIKLGFAAYEAPRALPGFRAPLPMNSSR